MSRMSHPPLSAALTVPNVAVPAILTTFHVPACVTAPIVGVDASRYAGHAPLLGFWTQLTVAAVAVLPIRRTSQPPAWVTPPIVGVEAINCIIQAALPRL